MKKLLNISDINKNDFFEIIDNAQKLATSYEDCLSGKQIGLIFEKNSTRTRLSFQVGINQLGGNAVDVKFEELNLNRFESFEDTFEIMSCYLDCIVFRTTNHSKLELALKYFKKPIINALSDISHPCQAISDLYTLNEHFGRMGDLNIVWIGDLNNVLFSLVEVCDFLDDVTIDVITDKRLYEANKETYSKFNKINFYFDLIDDVLNKADCIMTDVFTSMNDKDDKEKILNRFQINSSVMSKTKDSTVFMHCLPAKINSEVTSDVIKGKKSIVIKQAENRLHAQRGILKWLSI